MALAQSLLDVFPLKSNIICNPLSEQFQSPANTIHHTHNVLKTDPPSKQYYGNFLEILL
jgi:hypothetical protein